MTSIDGVLMDKITIVTLIKLYSNILGFDPNLAVAVAETESQLNPEAVGLAGEVGLYQILPQYVNISKEQLKNVHTNIIMGIMKLKEAKKYCVHQIGITWLTCYNYGMTNAKKVKHPHLFPYVQKVSNQLRQNKINRSVCGVK